MKGGTVQISWHGSDPILSVDFHLLSGLLATGGADRDIKLWSLHRLEKSTSLPPATFKANLSYHGSAVNVLRFSPSGELLASGADSGELLIWKLIQNNDEIPSWKVWKTLRFHLKDVLDLGWSPDGAYLVSGSVDNTCIIWNVTKGTVEQVLADHQHYVQGVTWDPAGKYVASLSGDRTCRIYSPQIPTKKNKSKEKKEGSEKRLFTCHQVLCKRENTSAPFVTKVDADGVQKQVAPSKQYLFYDENMPSFFRRLSWSPDGSFLILPAGVEKQYPDVGSCSVSYIVSRNDLSRPVLQLPASSKPVVASRFCPVVFSLSPNKSWKHDTSVPGVTAFKLPYRVVFAVATLNSVFIYDTEQSCPIAIFGGLHYAPITDLAWSSDARFLAVSSQDGYCTLVGFDEGDLGIPLPTADLPANIASRMHVSPTAGIQDDFRDVATLMESSEKATDVPLSKTVQSIGPDEEVPSAAQPGVTLESQFTQNQPQSQPHQNQLSHNQPPQNQLSQNQPPQNQTQKIRRISPKPVLEDLEQSAVLNTHSCVNTSSSEILNVKETSSSGIQFCSNTSYIPLKVTQKKPGLEQCIPDENNGAEFAPGLLEEECREERGIAPTGRTVCVLNSAMVMEDDDYVHDHRMMKQTSNGQQSFAESASGPSTPLCQEHVCVGMTPTSFQKPHDQFADTYVRPLKFRRISPNLIPENLDKTSTLTSTLKPATGETALAPANGHPGLQPV